MPHWAEFFTLLVTIYSSDRLYSLNVADRFANWNQWVRPLPFTLASIALLVFCVMPGAGRLWKTLYAKPAHGRRPLIPDTRPVLRLVRGANVPGVLVFRQFQGTRPKKRASAEAMLV
ncbi:hypothetical protein ACZ91_41340 [Streptomyces regensis]|nr:hypothetical protein ACZ91_41340 [Streptomyces regensis]